MRFCGECSLCCKLMAVHELDKPQHQWCRHARPGKGGCVVYGSPDRPASCGTFNCAWLEREDGLADNLRPDRIHAVLCGATDGNGLSVIVDPAYPRAWETEPLAAVLRGVAESGVRVQIAVGKKKFQLFHGSLIALA